MLHSIGRPCRQLSLVWPSSPQKKHDAHVAPDTCSACRPRCRTVVHSASPPWLGAVGGWGCWCWGLRSHEQTSDASCRFFSRRFLASRFTAACVRWTPSRWRYPSFTLPSPSVKEGVLSAKITSFSAHSVTSPAFTASIVFVVSAVFNRGQTLDTVTVLAFALAASITEANASITVGGGVDGDVSQSLPPHAPPS